MPVLHMIDTSAVAAIVTGAGDVLARMKALPPTSVCMSALTRAELLHALNDYPASHRVHLVADQLIKIIRALPWDAGAADWLAQILPAANRANAMIGELDLMVAAHALALGAVLVTCQPATFEQIEAPLTIDGWSVQ